MTLPEPRQLVVLSVKNPAEAAQILMSLKLPRNGLWTALILMAALQAIIFAVSGFLVPGPSPAPALFGSPLRFFMMAAFALVLTVYALHWAGRLLGGEGSLEDVMVLVVWLQLLRVLVQVGALILSVTLPVLAMLFVLAATIIGIYILLHFINEAHRLGSLGRAAGVLCVAVVSIVVGLSVFLALIGVQLVGASGYV